MRMLSTTGLACVALVLAGCASAQVPTVAQASASAAFTTSEQALTYHVFMGELALQRGADEVAAQQYAQAAQLSTDPALARRATLLTYRANNIPLALKLSRRWSSLSPADPAPRQFEAVLNTRLGNVDAAVSEFNSLLQDAPGENLLFISEMLGKETGSGQSLPVMQKLVAAHSQMAEAHFALAQLALQYQNARLAVDEARRAVALKPGWNAAAVLEARALVAAGQSNAALALLQTRVKAAPDNTGLHLAYGALLAQVGKNSRAQTEFALILSQQPANSDALYSLGLLALQDSQIKKARSYFLRLLKTGRRGNDARYFLGTAAELEKQYSDALHWYQRVDGGQNWLPAQVSIARVLIVQGKAEAARDYMNSLTAADPDDAVRFRLAEAQLFSDAGDSHSALQVFDQSLAENPGNTELLYGRALLRENMGDVSAAESDLHEILSRQPDNADALNALGYTLTVYSTRYEEARGYIEKALQLKPEDPAIMDSMGWVEYRLGNYPQALGYLRKAYARFADPEVAAHLTEALWAAGDKQEAHQIWSAALKQHPDNAALRKLEPRFTP